MLEPLMQSILDPFDAYGSKSESEIFSILPPLAIMNNPRSSIFAPSPSPPVINGYASTGNGSISSSPYQQVPVMTSQSWAQNSSSDWPNQRAVSPSSSKRTRSPSSPPSTSTLRKSGTIKARPTVATTHDVLSTGTIKATDANSESLEESLKDSFKRNNKRDTVLTLKPPKPEPEGGEDVSQEVWLAPPQNVTQNGSSKSSDSGSIAPTPKRSTFTSSIHRLMGGGHPSSSSSSGGEKSQ